MESAEKVVLESRYWLHDEDLFQEVDKYGGVDSPFVLYLDYWRGSSLNLSYQNPSQGGSPAGIHGLFSGWYCGLASRKVTLGVSMAWAKGVTTGTLVRYETSCSRLPVICVIDWICMLACEYRDDKKDVRKSG
ncbi:hypothetical protein Tco_1132305 [Tanacetum coccineum]|uniref:Uncharacterized protein n=1 Tax=Tanacetum coccineum TaxID=301880 RepID=A0ABQ5JBJ7_9ASTR